MLPFFPGLRAECGVKIDLAYAIEIGVELATLVFPKPHPQQYVHAAAQCSAHQAARACAPVTATAKQKSQQSSQPLLFSQHGHGHASLWQSAHALRPLRHQRIPSS